MTSAELKHGAKLQEWSARIQDCRSSGLSVRAWCRQEEINAATDYRWERELLALAETEPCSSVSAVRFAERRMVCIVYLHRKTGFSCIN